MDELHKKTENFLKNDLTLPIPKDLSSLSPSERLDLLNVSIQRFFHRIPFQNILLISEAPENRRLPTLDEIVEDVVSGRGGLCFTDNSFFKLALERLGFDAFHVAASVSAPHSHIIIAVRSVMSEGDCYVVEVGCGYPSFSAISVDFERESATYKDSYCTYKLIKRARVEGDEADPYDVYGRWQKQDGVRPILPKDVRGEDGSWYRFYDFTLEPRSLEFFVPYIGPLYYIPPGIGPFHKMISISQFPDGKGVTFKSVIDSSNGTSGKTTKKFVLILEQEDGKSSKKTFLVDDESQFRESLEVAEELFPLLKNRLLDAFMNFKELDLTGN